LAQLAAAALLFGARARRSDLCEPERFEARSALAEAEPARLESRRDIPEPRVAGGVTLPSLKESAQFVLALSAERGPSLTQGPKIGDEPALFFVEVADLQPHLLAALQQPFRVSLDLLDGLSQIGEAELRVLNGRGEQRVLARQTADHAPLLFFA